MSVKWTLPAFAAHWLSDDDMSTVADWMADNGVAHSTPRHLVTVAGGAIAFGEEQRATRTAVADHDIATVTVPLRTEPPKVALPELPDELQRELETVCSEHDWSSAFGGVCVTCSPTRLGKGGQLVGHRDDAEPWPCPPVRAVMQRAGLTRPRRILGDCLSEADNAAVFGVST